MYILYIKQSWIWHIHGISSPRMCVHPSLGAWEFGPNSTGRRGANNRTLGPTPGGSSLRRAVQGLETRFLWIYLQQLVGGFNPSEKYESQLAWLFSIYGKKMKKECSKPPTSIFVWTPIFKNMRTHVKMMFYWVRLKESMGL